MTGELRMLDDEMELVVLEWVTRAAVERISISTSTKKQWLACFWCCAFATCTAPGCDDPRFR